MNTDSCPFCHPDREVIAENDYCIALFDKYPVSEGHALILTKDHKRDFFDLNDIERDACWELVEEVKAVLKDKYNPDGWNVGMNCGKSAGQTIFHFHCHLIPRYQGDMEDPRGGVRHCIDGMGCY